MASSLAFWLEKNTVEEISDDLTAELHFNYWLLSDEKVNFLDIGVRLSSQLNGVSKIYLYLPFVRSQFEYDPKLGSTVITNPSLASAVFNSSITGSVPSPDYTDYDFSDGSKSFSLRFFKDLKENTPHHMDAGVTIDQLKGEGCTLCFPIEMFELPDDRSIYFRFRIKLKSSEIISKVDRAKGRFITTDFDEHELVDFRLNESRNLPSTISRKVTNCKYLEKVHFFLIRDAYSDYKGAHSAYERCRLLEGELWKEYLNPVKLKGDIQMLIYHWKDAAKPGEDGIDHFAAFAKFTKRVVRKRELAKIAIYVILLGLLVNYLFTNVPKAVHGVTDLLSSVQDEGEDLSSQNENDSHTMGGGENDKQPSS